MDDTTFTTILGLVLIYSVIHFFFIQRESYKHRTDYEKVITWVAMISISLIFLGVMFG